MALSADVISLAYAPLQNRRDRPLRPQLGSGSCAHHFEGVGLEAGDVYFPCAL